MAKATPTKNDIDSTIPDEFGHFKHHFSITMELDKHPFMMAMAAIAVGLLIVYVANGVIKKNQSTVAATPAAPAATPPDTAVLSQPIPISVTVQPPTANPPPPTKLSTYTIVASDLAGGSVLHRIAQRFGITYDQLFAANSSTLGGDPTHAKFKAGTVLTIPSK